MSDLSDNERASGAIGTSGANGPGATMAGEPSNAPRSLDDRSRVSQRAPTADRAAGGPFEPTTGSGQMSPQGSHARNDRPEAADGVAPSSATDALVSNGDAFRSRWSSVQVGFVDDPRRAVEEAEQLVTDVITDLVEGFRQHRQRLEGNREATTDEMRMAFQRYRDFFDRLLNV
jgi:hypothetical protein